MIDKCKAETFVSDGKFRLAFNTPKILSQDERHEFLKSKNRFYCVNENSNLVFTFKSFKDVSIPIMVDPTRFEFTIKKYHNIEFERVQNAFFRVITSFVGKKSKPAEFFDTSPVEINGTVYMGGVFVVNFDDVDFHIFIYPKNDNSQFLIIDSYNKINCKKFLKYIDALLLGYAFISGNLYREKRYIFSAKDKDFQNLIGISFEPLKESHISNQGIYPSSISQMLLGRHNSVSFPLNVFITLCSKIAFFPEFRTVLELLIEGNTLSTKLKATTYSVALESITQIISDEFAHKFKPIKNKCLAKKIRKELKAVIQKYNTEFDEEGFDTLNRKIDVINSPTNKQKLLKPFELFNMKLPDREKNCIEKRNDFLHGRIPTTHNNIEQEFELEQIAYSLFFSICCLILKYINFSGFVFYCPSLNEYHSERMITDYMIKTI